MALTPQQKKLMLLSPVAWQLSDPAPTLGAELLTDFGFENWSDATHLVSWIEGIAGATTVNREAVVTHGGSFAARLDVDAGNAGFGVSQNKGVVGLWARASVWARASTASGVVARTNPGSSISVDQNLTDSYQQTIMTALSNQVGVGFFRNLASSRSIYWDDASYKHLANYLAGVNTSRTRQTVRAGLTIVKNFQAGVWSDGDDATDPQNYLLAYYNLNDNKVHIGKWLGGSFDSELGAVAAAYSADAELKISPDGDDRIIRYNGVDLATVTMTDAALIAGTYAGLFSTDSVNVSFTGATATATA